MAEAAEFGPEAFAAAWGVSRESRRRLESYAATLQQWNRAINLVGRGTESQLWWRHFHDSAQLAPLIPDGTRTLLDLGSGAGFPGLVLGILTGAEAHLVESDRRKAAFLREVARVTGSRPVFHVKRAEQLPDQTHDAVTARAFAPPAKLLPYVEKFLAPGGVALLPLGATASARLTGDAIPRNMTCDWLSSRTDPDGVILKLERDAP